MNRPDCDWNCDDCKHPVCFQGGQDCQLDDEYMEELEHLFDLTLRALSNPENYE